MLAGVAMGQSGWSKVEPDLVALAKAKGSTQVRVLVFLRRQHAAEAAAELAPTFLPRIDAVADALRQAAWDSRGSMSANKKNEAVLANSTRSLFELAVLRPYTVELDRLRTEYGDAIARRAAASSVFDLASARSLVEIYGGKVVDATTVVSAVVADVRADRVGAIASSDTVATIGMEHPMDPELNVSATAMLAQSFWNNGATGGPADVGVLDTGVMRAHPAFAGFNWEALSLVDNDGHGTHVCGIMCSKDATYRGMAWGADTVSVAATSSEGQSMVGLNYLMTTVVQRAEDVNHSFGYGIANGTDYRNTDQFFDGACDTFSVLVSKSTGNSGYGTTTITHPAPAYNLIAVGNVNDLNTAARSDDRINTSSSSGPTLAGRKKPDLCAPGTAIMSTYNNGGFASLTGTSMAAPHAGGSVVLLMGLGCPSPMASKAVLINSADAINSNNTSAGGDDVFVNGSRWDKAYGWGYINLANAYLHAPDVFERNLSAPGAQRSFKLFKGQMFANEKSTLTWNRHVAFNGSNYPTIIRALSNLDLRAYRQSDGVMSASSTSAIDNVEQLAVPADAMTVLKVSAEANFDPNVTTERYALATQENFTEAVGPVMTATWFKVPSIGYLNPFPLTVTVKNTGDLPLFGVSVLLSEYVVVAGPNPANIGTVMPGQSVQVNWTVKRAIQGSNEHAKVLVTSSSYGESWSWLLTDPTPL